MFNQFKLKLALAATPVLLAGAVMFAPPPKLIRFADRPSQAAWSAQLDNQFGPAMADCVRFEVAGHIAPADLDSMLARSHGDSRQFPRLARVVDDAVSRCRRRQALLDMDE